MGHLMRNTDPRFYPMMGPFLSRRAIVRELGSPLWDDEDKTWIISIEDDTVTAFCGIIVNKTCAQIVSFYVIPAYRGRGVGTALLQEALDYVRASGGIMLKATATPHGRTLFEAAGFCVRGAAGRYSKMERVLS